MPRFHQWWLAPYMPRIVGPDGKELVLDLEAADFDPDDDAEDSAEPEIPLAEADKILRPTRY